MAILAWWLWNRNRPSRKVRRFLSESLINDIEEISAKVGVPARIVAAIVAVESAGYPLAVGAAGERGLMQITPAALQDVNRYYGTDYTFDQMFSGILNLYVGSLFLKLQYQRMGNWQDAIRAYNAGERGAREGRGYEYLERVKKWL